MEFALALLFILNGLLWCAFPQWVSKKFRGGKESKDQNRLRTIGVILILLGLILFGLKAVG